MKFKLLILLVSLNILCSCSNQQNLSPDSTSTAVIETYKTVKGSPNLIANYTENFNEYIYTEFDSISCEFDIPENWVHNGSTAITTLTSDNDIEIICLRVSRIILKIVDNYKLDKTIHYGSSIKDILNVAEGTTEQGYLYVLRKSKVDESNIQQYELYLIDGKYIIFIEISLPNGDAPVQKIIDSFKFITEKEESV